MRARYLTLVAGAYWTSEPDSSIMNLGTLKKDWECLKGLGAQMEMACRKRAWSDICKGVARSALRQAKREKTSREKAQSSADGSDGSSSSSFSSFSSVSLTGSQ